MQSIGEYEYGLANLIGHGAFALVFKGQHKPVCYYIQICLLNDNLLVKFYDCTQLSALIVVVIS